jgi:chloramphenicol-sensitive protein RarD
MNSTKKGVFYVLLSYLLWGILPFYWRLLDFTSPFHILGCRITFALFFTSLVLFIRKNRKWLSLISNRDNRWFTFLSGLTITVNWGAYIWAVNTGHTVEASLGYYINPLVTILLGMFVFQERLTIIQWAAFGFAVLGVLLMTVFSGVFPWVSLMLALSFGFYGLFKKKNKAGSLEALGAETLAVLPIGLALLVFPPGGLPQLAAASTLQWLLLLFAGVVTVLPLYAFSKGAKLLPLSTLGFLQFINPTLLFFLGVFAFGEEFSPRKLWAFVCIWAAVGLYCLSLTRLET